MSELKPSDSMLDDAVPPPFSTESDRFLDQLLDTTPTSPAAPSREGLPPTYKMRHEPHYVDELETRSRRAADADVHTESRSGAGKIADTPSRFLVALTLGELTRGLEGLSSCFNLVSSTARPLRERLGLELAQVEARRAHRVSHSLRLLLDEPAAVKRVVNLADLVRQVVAEMQDELRLVRVTLTAELPDPGPTVWADSLTLGTGLSAILGALVSIAETAPRPVVLGTRITAGQGSVALTCHSDHAMPSGDVLRLFDLEWIDRPGGVAVAVMLAGARRAARMHGGQLEASIDASGGFVLSLTLPSRS